MPSSNVFNQGNTKLHTFRLAPCFGLASAIDMLSVSSHHACFLALSTPVQTCASAKHCKAYAVKAKVRACGRWAQWLAGLDFLPELPAGLGIQGSMTEAGLQRALAHYRRERRAFHILATLVQRAQDASELGLVGSPDIQCNMPHGIQPYVADSQHSMLNFCNT